MASSVTEACRIISMLSLEGALEQRKETLRTMTVARACFRSGKGRLQHQAEISVWPYPSEMVLDSDDTAATTRYEIPARTIYLQKKTDNSEEGGNNLLYDPGATIGIESDFVTPVFRNGSRLTPCSKEPNVPRSSHLIASS